MWKLIKQLDNGHRVAWVDDLPQGQLVWQFKSLTYLDHDFNCIWERQFNSLNQARGFDAKFVLVQEVNGGAVFMVSKEKGEIVKELQGGLYLSNSLMTPNGCLIRSESGGSVDWKLISPEGNVIKTPLPDSVLFKFSHDSYLIAANRTTIECYNIEDGEKKWGINTTDLKYSADAKVDVPIFMTVVKHVLVTVFTSHAAAFDIATGKLIWENGTGARYMCCAADENLFLLENLTHLYSINATSGNVIMQNDLILKNNHKIKSTQYQNLMEDLYKSNLVQDEQHLYFCLRSAPHIVAVNKRTLGIADSFPVVTDPPGEMFNENIILSRNRLFIPFHFKTLNQHSLRVYERS
ncbi:PQQ-binding-like beta-propeller repeat protein [Chryseolinea soli]|uniref:Pyrrolo-quinoline quinone repeat domain-containing protein n=1 Tax=Chryseolinea soli TaxID=2321403 RepID=A0A385SNW2_9BACT|nr:PQQ-binding-like beta-propeller repeat protein [Chryseolinea soli]AYB32532.1 hypothetical protein D4L85_18980 [Chryseolinea soli]